MTDTQRILSRCLQLEANTAAAYTHPRLAAQRAIDARKPITGAAALFHRVTTRLFERADTRATNDDTTRLTLDYCRQHRVTLAELIGDAAQLSLATLVACGTVRSAADLRVLAACARDFVTCRERCAPGDLQRFLGDEGAALGRELLTADAWRNDVRWTATDLIALGVTMDTWPAASTALHARDATYPPWQRGTDTEWALVGVTDKWQRLLHWTKRHKGHRRRATDHAKDEAAVRMLLPDRH